MTKSKQGNYLWSSQQYNACRIDQFTLYTVHTLRLRGTLKPEYVYNISYKPATFEII